MTDDRIRRARTRALAVIGTLAAAWVLPPVASRLKHLCPVRPDGVAQSYAVPAYSRKYGISCSVCHTAFPVLNEAGRKFKENGYVMDRGEENKAAKWLPDHFPWAAVVKGEPFGKTKSLKPEIAPIKDIGMFFSDGAVAKNWSYWAEMHMRSFDNETNPNAYFFNFERARVGYHYNPYLNLLGGFGSIVEGVDTYETLASPIHSMQGNRASDILDHDRAGTPMDQHYLAVQGSVGKENVGALKYFAAVGAGWGAPSAFQQGNKQGDTGALSGIGAVDAGLGQGPLNYNFRVVLDSLRGAALGAYYQTGHNDWRSSKNTTPSPANTPTNQAAGASEFINNVQAWALDGLAEFGGLTARAAFMDHRVSDEQTGIRIANRAAFYTEAFYTLKDGNAPWLAPMIRYEWLTDRTPSNASGVNVIGGAAGSYPKGNTYKDYIVTALSYFPAENVRLIGEFWANTKNRVGTASVNGFCDNKFQTSVNIGF